MNFRVLKVFKGILMFFSVFYQILGNVRVLLWFFKVYQGIVKYFREFKGILGYFRYF